MLIAKSFGVGPRRGGLPSHYYLLGATLGAKQIDSAWQSCADKAQAAVLAELNEGVRGFHIPTLIVGTADGK
ncbi:hypothetical protein [Pseudomonas orientalis]|uniref:hypothetical protein n=1 Tax=Pseudomonas orientalis TaxID=76758 RepID=UPI001F151C46|nr:hypothetical protein [Pseudomonas orientalis]